MSDEFNDLEAILSAIAAEGVKTEALYDELKEHFDTVRENSRRTSGSLTFLTKQTENLITLRGASLGVLKALADVHQKRFGNQIKVKTMQMKEDQADDGVPFKVVKALIDALKIGSDQINGAIDITPVEDGGMDEDAILEQRLLDAGIEDAESIPEDPEPAEGEEGESGDLPDPRLVCDELGEWHILQGTLIVDVEYDMPEDPPAFDSGQHGEIRATAPDGSEVEIIRTDILERMDRLELETANGSA